MADAIIITLCLFNMINGQSLLQLQQGVIRCGHQLRMPILSFVKDLLLKKIWRT